MTIICKIKFPVKIYPRARDEAAAALGRVIFARSAKCQAAPMVAQLRRQQPGDRLGPATPRALVVRGLGCSLPCLTRSPRYRARTPTLRPGPAPPPAPQDEA